MSRLFSTALFKPAVTYFFLSAALVLTVLYMTDRIGIGRAIALLVICWVADLVGQVLRECPMVGEHVKRPTVDS